MLLLIDIGNTRIKWATFDRDTLEPQQAVPHASWTLSECLAAFGTLPMPKRVLVSNVGGERVAAIVRDASVQSWGIEAEFIHATTAAGGLTNAYPEPANLGVDRWLAMIGAYAEHEQALCVVGIGTAATIDGVDAAGHHLGGLIIPGPDLMVGSLLRNTSEIARRAQAGSVGLGVFANNTLGAVHQGAAHAVAALAERAVESMKAQLGAHPLLILTGGASAEVARLIRFPHIVISDLILRGLIVLAGQSRSGPFRSDASTER
jgi:type III pantothenate kinase